MHTRLKVSSHCPFYFSHQIVSHFNLHMAGKYRYLYCNVDCFLLWPFYAKITCHVRILIVFFFIAATVICFLFLFLRVKYEPCVAPTSSPALFRPVHIFSSSFHQSHIRCLVLHLPLFRSAYITYHSAAACSQCISLPPKNFPMCYPTNECSEII